MAYGRAAYPPIMSLVQKPVLLQWFGLGAALYLVIHLFLSKYLKFWFAFEHELTHSIFAVLTFSRVKHFMANETKGGEVQYSGSIGRFIVTLAPYFCPTGALILLPLNLIIKQEFLLYYQLVIGFFFMYHLLSTYQEFKLDQTDLHVYGIIFSIAFILIMNIILAGTVIFASLLDWSQVGNFMVTGLQNFYALIRLGIVVISQKFA
jgi:hypothetical protein